MGDAYYNTTLNVWVSRHEEYNRYWNGFGIGRPIDWNSNSIIGEINFPVEGIDRRVAGAFGIDEHGSVFVLHRGKIGGGKKGIGKTYFLNHFIGKSVTASDGNRISEFCLVAELSSVHFVEEVGNFIDEVRRIKMLNPSYEADFAELSDFVYTDERSGQVVTESNEPRVIDRTHGLVVKALANKLQAKGHTIANDRNRDLFIHVRGNITTLFEIKTSCATQCLYAAVGQLLIYSMPMPKTVKLIAVFPNKLSRKVERRLISLGISLMYYQWRDGEPIFPD